MNFAQKFATLLIQLPKQSANVIAFAKHTFFAKKA